MTPPQNFWTILPDELKQKAKAVISEKNSSGSVIRTLFTRIKHTPLLFIALILVTLFYFKDSFQNLGADIFNPLSGSGETITTETGANTNTTSGASATTGANVITTPQPVTVTPLTPQTNIPQSPGIKENLHTAAPTAPSSPSTQPVYVNPHTYDQPTQIENNTVQTSADLHNSVPTATTQSWPEENLILILSLFFSLILWAGLKKSKAGREIV